MKLISLTKGYFAQVDDEDFDYLNQFKWYAKRAPHTIYAIRTATRREGKTGKIHMHREVLERHLGTICWSLFQTDHEDRNGLNNTIKNLSAVPPAKNAKNKGIQTNNTTGFKGVYFHKLVKKYAAVVQHSSKKIHLGYYHTKEQAADAYDQAAKLLGFVTGSRGQKL